VRLRVVVWHPRAGWQREADLQDIGLGGVCLRVPDPLVVRDRVTISFVAPTLWDPVTIPARITWVAPATHVEPARAGVAFEPKQADAMFALFELLGTLGYDEE
jgi:hypothetical protein